MAENESTSAVEFQTMETEQDETLGARQYDPMVKQKAYTYIFHLTHSVVLAAGLTWQEYLNCDLDVNGRIEGAVSTLHNQLRKIRNPENAMDPTKFAALNAPILGSKICNMGIALANFKGQFKGSVDYRTVCPIVNMLTSFKLVKDEVRIGVTQIVPKKGMKKKTVSVATYGLSAHHAPYLKLITLKPERRSGLMMCIGPLAHCISLLEDKVYPEKSSRALREELKHLPMKEAIVECCVRNSKASVGGLLGALGDVLLLTTDRTHCKMTPPLVSFMRAYTSYVEKDKKVYYNFTKASTEFDFSGKGAVHFYNKHVAGKEMKWLSDDAKPVNSSQIFFHACWGTHFEDLGILCSMTDINTWEKRKDLSQAFLKKTGKVVTFICPVLKVVSKMVSACGTKMLGTVQPMVQCKPTFSGKRKRVFSEEFFACLENSVTGAYDSSPISLTRVLVDLKQELKRNNLSLDFGTTAWFNAAGVTPESWGQETDIVLQESGEYFYS